MIIYLAPIPAGSFFSPCNDNSVHEILSYKWFVFQLIKQIDEVGDKMSNEINFILMKMKNKEDIPIKEPEESDRLDMSKFIQGSVPLEFNCSQKEFPIIYITTEHHSPYSCINPSNQMLSVEQRL